MMPIKKRIRNTLVLVMALIAGHGIIIPANAGIPVIDGGNLIQNIISTIESVAQTAKQIQEYRTQLQQYQNMLQNTASPSAQIWDRAVNTMANLRNSIDTLAYHKRRLGSIEAYLNKSQDTKYYNNSPCFNPDGCSETEWAAIKERQVYGSEAQKRANDAVFKGLDQQQEAMEADARQLEQLQYAARGADGQMQAIGYANQLASQQSNQLLQIRGLLIAQQNSIATRNQALADREAQEEAGAEQLRKGRYQTSPAVTW